VELKKKTNNNGNKIDLLSLIF